ncbi:MAG: two-component system, cell cycle response regulator [Chloroflexia bacterium]|jgi:diguanylate cyclase (GGDEF)-like protein|nr:two-component system, cell cycle response regulator [Chloroflexia bacterium]
MAGTYSQGSNSAVVLVVDPDPMNQRALRDRLVRLGYTARSADDADSAQAIVEATPPDVVIATYSSTQAEDWPDLQTNLGNWGIPYVAFEEADMTSESSAGVEDGDLRERIREALRSRKLQDALVAENTRLAAERLYDPTTGLFNRRYVMIRVEEEIKRSARHAYPLSCLLLDIDKLDDVNERFGAHVGDAILRDMAHIITRTLRATDIVARYRDDEFISLLTDTDSTGAQVAANRLRDAVAAYKYTAAEDDEPITLTASVGVAYWEPANRPGEGTWEPQLIALAERALRAAKLSGPGRLVMLQAS